MAKSGPQTVLTFLGGVNRDRIGGNCQVIEHKDENGDICRIMIDLGSVFIPYGTEFSVAYPNVEEYFNRTDPETKIEHKASKPVSGLFITHAHQDHIGALIDCVKMGYHLPKIYTSEYTSHCIRFAFAKEALPPPDMQRVKNADSVFFHDNMEVTPFDVAHSAVDALGFMVQSFNVGKPYASIVDPGDFLVTEKMPLGHAFNRASFLKLLKEKNSPITVFELDSTSTNPKVQTRIGFEKAVENTYDVCMAHNDCSVIVSPVIASSWNNIAIDLEVARRLGAKVFLDGQGLKIPRDALRMRGYDQYDDVFYHGNLQTFLADKTIKKKYIICTGAFGQGLEEYNNNIGQTPFSQIYMSSLTKMALDMHPDIRVSDAYLFVMRQRVIDAINGQSGPEIFNRLAGQGATVVITPGDKSQKHFEEVVMQDSGHISAEEMFDLMSDVKKLEKNIVVLPIHGTPEQCLDTAKLMDAMQIETHTSSNWDSLEIMPNGLQNIAKEKPSVSWVAVRQVFPGMDNRKDVPPEGIKEYWEVDENYNPIRKICEIACVVSKGVKSNSSGKKIDVEALAELPQSEKISPYTHKNKKNKKGRYGKKGDIPWHKDGCAR